MKLEFMTLRRGAPAESIGTIALADRRLKIEAPDDHNREMLEDIVEQRMLSVGRDGKRQVVDATKNPEAWLSAAFRTYADSPYLFAVSR